MMKDESNNGSGKSPLKSLQTKVPSSGEAPTEPKPTDRKLSRVTTSALSEALRSLDHLRPEQRILALKRWREQHERRQRAFDVHAWIARVGVKVLDPDFIDAHDDDLGRLDLALELLRRERDTPSDFLSKQVDRAANKLRAASDRRNRVPYQLIWEHIVHKGYDGTRGTSKAIVTDAAVRFNVSERSVRMAISTKGAGPKRSARSE